jgi:hypothetical protein
MVASSPRVEKMIESHSKGRITVIERRYVFCLGVHFFRVPEIRSDLAVFTSRPLHLGPDSQGRSTFVNDLNLSVPNNFPTFFGS